MRNPGPSVRPSISELLWHWLMGTALGVLCAGLLLNIGGALADGLIAPPDGYLGRLRFLLGVAFLFGIGATLTGASFITNDKS